MLRMLDVLETAALRPQSYQPYEAVTIERVIPSLRAEGAEVLGLWYTIVGKLDEAVTLTRYRDLVHWAEVQRRLAEDRGSARKALDERAGLCVAETTRLMEPSARARGVALDLDGRAIFAHRTQQLTPGAWTEYERITATEMWPRLIPRGAEPVGLWRTLGGRANEATLLTQYRDLAAWEVTHPAAGRRDTDEADDARQRRKRLLLGEHVRLMRAGRYRPAAGGAG